MFSKLLKFEWHYNTRNLLFYVPFLVYLSFGFVLGGVVNSTFSGLYRNAPYMIAYFIGLFSLNTVFSTTVFVAQSFLREAETRFDSIIYASPVDKKSYLGSRFLMAFFLNTFSYAMFAVGLMAGHLMPWIPKDELQPFSVINYLWPFLTIAIPNIFFCTAVLTGFAWFTRNKLMIYVGGIFVFILYTIGSIFSNSPVFAGVSPASAQAMAIVAKVDPFGLAAFFEQTRYWTAFEKNVALVKLSGNFLINRLLWVGLSSLLVVISYHFFSFRKVGSRKIKKNKSVAETQSVEKFERLQQTEYHTVKHNFGVFKSFFRIDAALILKGIPFTVLVILVGALMGIEIKDEINGGIRMAESITSTGLMITTILDRMPTLLLLIMLFYSSELLRRSESAGIAMLEKVTPYNARMAFISKLVSLWMIPVLLLILTILIAIAFQMAKGNAPVEWDLYLSLFYYIGLPMFLAGILMLSIQSLIANRYLGLAIATVVTLLLCTGLGNMVEINHPLLRFAEILKIEHFDMNGFGKYTTSFHISMLYNLGFALLLLFLAGRSSLIFSAKKRRIAAPGFLQILLLIGGALLFMGFGSYIFYQTNVKSKYTTKDEQQHWSQQYEEKYRRFEDLPQPTIASVSANIDLYPEDNRYRVKGIYHLINNSQRPIDSILVYVNDNTALNSLAIPNAELLSKDADYGHIWYKLNIPLQPAQELKVVYDFSSSWSPFIGHVPFNSIIDNGSFMRISRYFPQFGYQPANEIESEKERKKRGMVSARPIRKLKDKENEPYDFIDFEAIISTSGDQTAISSGDLLRRWKSGSRNFFHYKCGRKIPFRFAVSSARYEIRREVFGGVAIEVYYDKKHGRNIDALLEATKSTLTYCRTNFGDYPYKVIRYAEISSFAEGFAATAYPNTIYMKENFGFYSDISRGDKEDIINQLAGHELSHQWWGGEQFSPQEKEGGWILTETLAQYTELMLYEKRHGRERALETVKVHSDIYLSSRSFADEMPLYKTHYDTPHLPYNKGMVVMHQLRLLLGEEKVNLALKALLKKHSYPQKPADSEDLLNEIYKVTPQKSRSKVDELLKNIITYSSKIESVSSRKVARDKYEVTFEVSSRKFRESAKGKRTQISNDPTLEIGVYDANGKLTVKSFSLRNNRVQGTILLTQEPASLIVDPNLRTIDTFPEDNKKELSL